jgi:molybdopterin molybdotransferase
MEYLTVDEALLRVVAPIKPLASERVPLYDADGRVLAESLASPLDLPPFANSAMDGFAVIAGDTIGATETSPARLRVIDRIVAGSSGERYIINGTAARIMTGAPIPPGADAVIKFEDTDNGQQVVSLRHAVLPGHNIRLSGEDIVRGTNALEADTRLNPAAIGLIAAMGYPDVACIRRPRVAILGTGSELVQLGRPLGSAQIYDSNSYMIAALVRRLGADVIVFDIAQDKETAIHQKILASLQQKVDLIITSGGVSAGDFDLVKDVLREAGNIDFWQIRQRPGKPLAFGSVQGVPLLGLPGNPVAAFVGCALYGTAILRAMQGLDPKPTQLQAQCAEDIRNGSGKRNFLRGIASFSDAQLTVRLASGQLPTQLVPLAMSNCLIVAHETQPLYRAGEPIMIIPLT